MCPGVHASGSKIRNGPITRHGNRRIRTALVELAWRCLRFQPDYRPVQKWRSVLASPKASGGAKKKAIVAVGRRLAIDLWRMNTGRTTPRETRTEIKTDELKPEFWSGARPAPGHGVSLLNPSYQIGCASFLFLTLNRHLAPETLRVCG